MTTNNLVFVFAGEHSGDLHGGSLINALKKQYPDLSFVGVGGKQMIAQGLSVIFPIEDFQVMGFSDVLLAFPRLWNRFHQICKYILTNQPTLIILIDYPGFNLRLAQALRKKGYRGKIVQCISPTVWAWGKQRIQQMVNSLNLLLTIYPFESAYFANTSLPVEYIGNPIKEIVTNHLYDDHWTRKCGIEETKNLIALFPGSREAEIRRNLPKQLEASALLHQEQPYLSFAISFADEHCKQLIRFILKQQNNAAAPNFFLIPKAYSYELMRDCRSAIAKSGTVTLELALHQRPTVVVYETSLLNRFIAKYVLKLKLSYYCIVNILGGKEIFPELIKDKFSPYDIYHQLKEINDEGLRREKCLEGCREVIVALHKETLASDHAAATIGKFCL